MSLNEVNTKLQEITVDECNEFINMDQVNNGEFVNFLH